MRTILRKIQQEKHLTDEEYAALHSYSEDLRWNSPEAYLHFYHLYADQLARNYLIFLPRFRYERDDFYDFLLQNKKMIDTLPEVISITDTFPLYLHEYLLHTFGSTINLETIHSLTIWEDHNLNLELPMPRQGNPVYKFEDNNPYKEPGLKNHFERIGKYTFISRIQSYRYLTGVKSVNKIEVISPDCLGGIYTNKEKSIYYYIFLTENNSFKAMNACNFLNRSLYGRQ